MAPRYGENNYNGASSDVLGQRTESKLAAELRSKQSGLDSVIATGGRKTDSADVFNGRGNIKAAPAVAAGMKDPNASNPKVPGPGRQPFKR